MFGTIYRMRVKSGQEQAIEELSRRWDRKRRPHVTGYLGEYLLRPKGDSNEIWGLVIFDSEANYRKNAEDPEQDRWYREWRALLEEDLEWHDGEVSVVGEVKLPNT